LFLGFCKHSFVHDTIKEYKLEFLQSLRRGEQKFQHLP
jgi:hypothetical protein